MVSWKSLSFIGIVIVLCVLGEKLVREGNPSRWGQRVGGLNRPSQRGGVLSTSGSKMAKQHGLIPEVLAQLFTLWALPLFVLLDQLERGESEREGLKPGREREMAVLSETGERQGKRDGDGCFKTNVRERERERERDGCSKPERATGTEGRVSCSRYQMV